MDRYNRYGMNWFEKRNRLDSPIREIRPLVQGGQYGRNYVKEDSYFTSVTIENDPPPPPPVEMEIPMSLQTHSKSTLRYYRTN